MSESPLKHETTDETITFEHFGRTWTLPAQVRMSHLEQFDSARRRTANLDLALAQTYLTKQELAELREINPSAEELDDFGTALAKAMGFGDAGNF